MNNDQSNAAPTQAAGGEALEREIVAWLRNEATYEDDRCNTRRAKRFNDAANFIERAAAPADAVEPRTTPLCRDCADFGPICPSSGQPCDKRAAAVTAASKAAEDIQPVCRHGVYPVIACEVCKRAAAAPEGLTEREPWLPYLSDRADGVKGRYAVARWNPAGYREVWNLRGHGWGAYSDDVLTLEQAHELLRTARFGPATPDAKTAEARKPLADIEICEATFDISLSDFDQMSDFKIAIARAVLGIGG